MNKKQLYKTLIRIQPKLLGDRYLIQNGGKIKTLSRDLAINMIPRLGDELRDTGMLSDEFSVHGQYSGSAEAIEWSDPKWEETIILNTTTITRVQTRTGGNLRRNQGAFWPSIHNSEDKELMAALADVGC